MESCTSAEEGFRRILFERPDILFLDIILPESDGFKLGLAIDIIHEKKISTVFLSADKRFESVVPIHKYKGNVKFFGKPVDMDKLISHTEEVFAGGEAETVTRDVKKTFKKPLAVVIVGLLLILEPLIKIVFFRVTMGFSFATILSNVFQISGIRELFEFWVLFPLSGIMLLNIRKWPYFIFLALQAYAVYMHITYMEFTWPYSADFPHFSSLILLVFSLAVIVYFLIPAVRRPYFNPHLRHWENGPGFSIDIPCIVVNKRTDEFMMSTLKTISQYKARVSLPARVTSGDSVLVNFTFYSFNFSLLGKVDETYFSEQNHEAGISFNTRST